MQASSTDAPHANPADAPPSDAPPASDPVPGRCYRVGGAVRDAMLGLPVSDTDWVVVGATPAQMIEAGFRPVGKDFPVFLHPRSHEEYALARTERKSGPGYRGFDVHFAPDVTLEQDLGRRDLTINAMALDGQGRLIDPHRGRNDVRDRMLRHVGPAFVEDPVRILRLARFAARFPEFHVAPETQELMRRMVTAREAHALVPERIWQEISRGLMAQQPSRMLDVLVDCGAWPVIAPEVQLDASVDRTHSPPPAIDARTFDSRSVASRSFASRAVDSRAVDSRSFDARSIVDRAAVHQCALPVRFACLMHSCDRRAVDSLAARWRVSADCRDAAGNWAEHRASPAFATTATAADILELLQDLDALRRPGRLDTILDTAATVFDRDRRNDEAFRTISVAASAARKVDQGAIARSLTAAASSPGDRAGRVDTESLKARIRAARLAAIDSAIRAARNRPHRPATGGDAVLAPDDHP